MDFWLKNLLLFYKNYGILALFYKELADINADSSFNIILGDFNISVIEQNSQMSQLFLKKEKILDTMDVKFMLIQFILVTMMPFSWLCLKKMHSYKNMVSK